MTTRGSRSTFLVGGARSGKSTLAQKLALASGGPVTIVVTAIAFDAEMEDRIVRHQDDRPASWDTVEAPIDLFDSIANIEPDHVLILDCLTLWLTNLLLADVPTAEIERRSEEVARQLTQRSAPVIVVSNEVGLGIVPGDPLSRTFRDLQGRANQSFARAFDRAYFVAAGRVVPLIDPRHEFEELA